MHARCGYGQCRAGRRVAAEGSCPRVDVEPVLRLRVCEPRAAPAPSTTMALRGPQPRLFIACCTAYTCVYDCILVFSFVLCFVPHARACAPCAVQRRLPAKSMLHHVSHSLSHPFSRKLAFVLFFSIFSLPSTSSSRKWSPHRCCSIFCLCRSCVVIFLASSGSPIDVVRSFSMVHPLVRLPPPPLLTLRLPPDLFLSSSM